MTFPTFSKPETPAQAARGRPKWLSHADLAAMSPEQIVLALARFTDACLEAAHEDDRRLEAERRVYEAELTTSTAQHDRRLEAERRVYEAERRASEAELNTDVALLSTKLAQLNTSAAQPKPKGHRAPPFATRVKAVIGAGREPVIQPDGTILTREKAMISAENEANGAEAGRNPWNEVPRYV